MTQTDKKRNWLERVWPSVTFILGFGVAVFALLSIMESSSHPEFESSDERINLGVEIATIDPDDPLLAQRTIILNTQINSLTVQRVVAQLFYLNAMDQEAPINLILSSTGGYADDGAAIVEAIHTVAAPVNTIAMGTCRSAATEILAAGTGDRVITPYTTIGLHIHPIPEDSPTDSKIRVGRTRTRVYWREIASIPEELLTSSSEVSVYLEPEKAVLYGIADFVGYATPNLGVPADRDPRERGSRPLNTDR